MSPEERRRLRKEKILKRSKLSEQEVANSLINNNIKDLIKKSEKIRLKKTNPEKIPEKTNLNYFKKKEKQTSLKKTKILLFIILGTLSSIFTFLLNIENHPNIFLLFFLIDIGLNFFVFHDKVYIDKDIYSKKMGGIIKVFEKLSLLFEIIDDLACFFISFIVVSCFIHYFKLN